MVFFRSHNSKEQYVAYVDDETPLVHSLPSRNFPAQMIKVWSLEHETDDQTTLDLPPLPHLALGSGFCGPAIAPTVQLDTILDKHAQGSDEPKAQNVTKRVIQLNIPSPPQRAYAILRRSASIKCAPDASAFEYFDIPEHIDDIVKSSPVKSRVQAVNKARQKRTKEYRSPKEPKSEQTSEAIKAQRQRERITLRNANAFGNELADAMPSRGVTSRGHNTEFTAWLLAQKQSVKYAHNESDLDHSDLKGRSSISKSDNVTVIKPTYQYGHVTQYYRTPMGERYLQGWLADSPSHRWTDAEMGSWCSAVPDGTFVNLIETVSPETSNPTLDDTCYSSVSARQFEGLWRELDEQYAENDVDWARMSDSSSYEGFNTSEQASIGDTENKLADQAFFGASA